MISVNERFSNNRSLDASRMCADLIQYGILFGAVLSRYSHAQGSFITELSYVVCRCSFVRGLGEKTVLITSATGWSQKREWRWIWYFYQLLQVTTRLTLETVWLDHLDTCMSQSIPSDYVDFIATSFVVKNRFGRHRTGYIHICTCYYFFPNWGA